MKNEMNTLVITSTYSSELLDLHSNSNNDTLFLTLDEMSYLKLKKRSVPSVFLLDLLTADDVEEISKACFDSVQKTWSEQSLQKLLYKGLPMGWISEFYLLPEFMRIFRIIFCINKVLETYEYKKIVISGPGVFSDTARQILSSRQIPFESMGNDKLTRLKYAFETFKEGKRNSWAGRPFKYLVMEPILKLFALVDALIWKLSNNDKTSKSEKKCIFFSADKHTLSVCKRLLDSAWDSFIFGPDYRFRKKGGRGLDPLEGHIRPGAVLGMIGAFFHFLMVWVKTSSDKNYISGFEFMGFNFWHSVKNNIRLNMLITFPLLFLDHLISSEAFKKHPNSLLLVFSDAPPGYKALVHTARRWGVKSLTIQHGILGIVLQHKESKASSLFSAFHTDYYASWGTRTIEIYSSFDASMKDKIHVTGSPRYDTFRNPKIYDRHEVLDKYRLPDKKIVLIAPGWQQDITVSSSDFEDMKMIEAVLEAQMAPELEGKVHVVVKPHPSGDSMLLNEFCGQMAEIYPDLSVVRGDINELISVADICVGSLTTVILEAMFFKKPSISFLHPLKKQSVPYVSWGAALSASNSQEMADAIESLLFDNEVLKSIINKQESFIEYAAYKIDGGATERVSNLIEQIMDGKKPSVYM